MKFVSLLGAVGVAAGAHFFVLRPGDGAEVPSANLSCVTIKNGSLVCIGTRDKHQIAVVWNRRHLTVLDNKRSVYQQDW